MQGYNLGGAVGEQAPAMPQGMPQGMPQPAMPNDPRMGAAMGLVDDSIEKFNLDPQTESLMLKNQALDLLKAADNVGKMNPPQQQDINIQEQTEQGIVGMLQRLSPGMQQRGQQMQRSQARQMLGGGAPARPPMPQQNMARPPMPQQNMARPPARPPMPQQNMARPPARFSMGGMPVMGAPNMARMADGGIVGYQEGGLLGKLKEIDTKLNAASDASQNERTARGRKLSDYNILAEPFDATKNIMYDTGIAGALQKLTGYESQLDKPVEEDPTAKQLRNFMAVQDAFKARKAAGAGKEELRRIMEDLNSYTSVVPNIEADAARARGGMARGGIIGYRPGGEVKGYAGPNGSQVGYDYSKDPNLYAPTEIAQPDDGILKFAQQQTGRDAGAEAATAAERFRELTGAKDLMAQRTKAQEALESQREARFSPEESSRRRRQAGLAGLAEKGLGGFSEGRTEEMDKISGEKLSAAEASVADMDKLISELRELGMGQFEAEKQARDMVETAVNQGLSVSQAVFDSRQRAKDAAATRATQERGQNMTSATQRYVADKNAGRLTDQVRGVDAIKREAVAEGTPITDAEAMRRYFGMQSGVQGVVQRGLAADMALRETAIERAQEERNSLIGAMRQRYNAAEDPEALFQERIKYYVEQLGGTTPLASTTTGVDISGINPTAVQNLKGDPTAQNRAYFDAAFGVGSAAAVLGQ